MAVSSVWAVIPTAGRECLAQCLDAVRPQVDGVVLVTNGGYIHPDDDEDPVVIEHSGPVNISRWWNLGVDACPPDADVLILNDDAIMGPGSVDVLRSGLSFTSLSYVEDGSGRITGWCFMLRAGSGLRADESMVWWASDNDLHWRAAQGDGARAVRGVDVTHLYPNGYTNGVPSLAEQAGRDVETFRAKWGRLPY